MKDVKIIILLATLDIGGAEKQAIYLAEYLKYTRKANVRIVSLFKDGEACELLNKLQIPWEIVSIPKVSDADSICVNPLEDFFLINDSFSCYENEIQRGNLVAAGYLASTKGNRLMKCLVEKIHKMKKSDLLFDYYSAWKSVGPVLLTQTIHEQKYIDISTYPSYFFIPKHYTGISYEGPARIYAKQFWGSTPGSPFRDYNLERIKMG